MKLRHHLARERLSGSGSPSLHECVEVSWPRVLGGLGAAGVVEACRLMRGGALVLITAAVFAAVGATAVFFGARPLVAFADTTAGAVIALVIGAALALCGPWSRFILGAERSATAEPSCETLKTLIRIGLFWGALVTLTGATLALIVVGVFILVVGAILLIVGYVGLSLLALKLYEEEKSVLYPAAILFIIGIFVGLASLVGWILLRVALGESIKRAQAPTPPAPL